MCIRDSFHAVPDPGVAEVADDEVHVRVIDRDLVHVDGVGAVSYTHLTLPTSDLV